MRIKEIQKAIHENAKLKGFYEQPKNIGEMLMLIVTEVSEACEADRTGNYFNKENYHAELSAQSSHGVEGEISSFKTHVKNTFEDELADIMIRVMDLAEFKGVDLEYHIMHKMRYNSLREYKHGKKY